MVRSHVCAGIHPALLYTASSSSVNHDVINLVAVSTVRCKPCPTSVFFGLLEEGICDDEVIQSAEICQPVPSFVSFSIAELAYHSVGVLMLTTYFSIEISHHDYE